MCSALYCVIQDTHPSSCLAAAGTRNGRRMRITQSISLSNIQTCALFARKGPPWGGRNLPDQDSNCMAGLFPDRRHSLENGGDLETANESGGAERDRTADPLLAKQVLSQLSYSPTWPPQKAKIAFRGPRQVPVAEMVGLGRVELPTSPLSGVRSNQLSYRPA